MNSSEHSAWSICVQALGLVLCLLGAVLLAAPWLIGPLFGLDAAPDPGPVLARAIGLRDIAVGILFAVLPRISVRATTLALLAVATIPLGDLVLVLWARLPSLAALLPHLASLACLAVLAVWGLRLTPAVSARQEPRS